MNNTQACNKLILNTTPRVSTAPKTNSKESNPVDWFQTTESAQKMASSHSSQALNEKDGSESDTEVSYTNHIENPFAGISESPAVIHKHA